MRSYREALPRVRTKIQLFGRDRRGTTAIEFGFVITPFLMLLFGVMGVGLFYFTETVLDQALQTASRQIRTGESHQLAGGELTVGNFRKEICSRSGGLIDCAKLSIIIDNKNSWTELKALPSCTDNKSVVVGSSYQDTDNVSSGAGGRSKVVVIVTCYPWTMAVNFPFLQLGNVNDGSARLIQSATIFESEPY